MPTVCSAVRNIVLMAALLSATHAAQAGRFQIDPHETKTTYETRYLGFIPLQGVFERMTGVLHYNTTKLPAEREAFIYVVIDATTLRLTTFNTDAKRTLLRGPEFFHVEKFPTIEFTSNKFRFDGDKLTAIDGVLAMAGMMKPVTLTVHKSGCEAATPMRPARCTASVDVLVNRADFGMNAWAATVSDQVRIAVEMVAVQTVAAGANVVAPGSGTNMQVNASKTSPAHFESDHWTVVLARPG